MQNYYFSYIERLKRIYFANFQEKACKQEDKLIAKLQEIELDNSLVAVLRRQAIILLEGGPTSGLGIGIHPESIPMHTFARFMFLSLLNYYPDLAYEVGLRAMRLPLLEEHEDSDDPMGGGAGSSLMMSRSPRWFTLGHIETQQCALSSTMLSAAKGNTSGKQSERVQIFRFRRRGDETPDGLGVFPEAHPQFFPPVQAGAGRVSLRDAGEWAQASDAAERGLRARSAGDADDAVLAQLEEEGDGAVACHLRYRSRGGGSDVHHAELVRYLGFFGLTVRLFCLISDLFAT